MPERFRTLPADPFDAIVVGAGLGGLCAGALLARRGARVLVLDRHYVAGGNATVFKRRGYEFDVGLHYIGGAGPLGVVPRILGACGADPVEFEELDPDGFDTLVFPDLTFRVPKGVAAFRRRLLEHFPAEARGIERYLAVLEPLVQLQRARQGARDALRALPRALRLLRWSTGTYGEFLRHCTGDERLRAVLAGQSGDYALPPSRAALPMAAGLVAHYMDGAYVPRGGGQIVADRLAEAIERQGGTILLRASARQIVVARGRVVGVEIESKHLGTRLVRAPVVISNADLKKTMAELVGARHLRPRTAGRARDYEMAPALGVVYLGLRRDLRAEGHPRTNYWVHGGYDGERPYAAVRRGELPDEPFAFISIATLKDPTNPRLAPPGVTNLQVMGLAPSAPAAWGVTAAAARDGTYSKSEAYRRRKRQFGETLLESARRVFPTLRDDIVYCEIATPLTHGRFTSSTDGTSYGIAATPAQSLWNRPGARTEIEGLYLCGASCRAGHGIVGAMMSGVMAASAARGRWGLGRLVGLARTRVLGPAEGDPLAALLDDPGAGRDAAAARAEAAASAAAI